MAWVIIGALAVIVLALALGPFLTAASPVGIPRVPRRPSPRPTLKDDIEEDYLMGKLDKESLGEALDDEEKGL